MAFLAGYTLGIATVLAYLIGEAFYEAAMMKRRRQVITDSSAD